MAKLSSALASTVMQSSSSTGKRAFQAVCMCLLVSLSAASGNHHSSTRYYVPKLQASQGLQLPLLKLPLAVSLKPPAAVNSTAQHVTAPPASISIPHIGPPQVLHKAFKVLQQLGHQPADQQQQLEAADSSSWPQRQSIGSRAVSVGFAANGAKASAHAVAHVQQPATGGLVAALANATAIANHASKTLAVSKSGAGNMAHVGTTVADTTAQAYADHLSTATADSGARSMGRGGDSTSAGTTTWSAATGGSTSIVAGTAVSSAGGHGSTAHVISDSTGAAKQHGLTRTRADSITVSVGAGTAATGSAQSTASSEKHGAAVSHSLMESFSLFGSRTSANSLVTARGSTGGVAASRDKAVGIGLWSSQAATNTSTEVVSTKLGLAVVTSVVRSITAQGRLACAHAIRRAAAELATGPQLNINDVTLHLGGKVPQKCLTSYKDLAVTAMRQIKAQQQAADPVTEAESQVQDFEQLKASVLAGLRPSLKAAETQVQDALHTLGQHP